MKGIINDPFPVSGGLVGEKRSPLHYIVCRARPYAIPILQPWRPPLSYHLRRNGPAIVKLLVECGANVNQQDANGMTPLRLACERRIGHNGVGYRDDQREQRMVDIIEELAKVKGIDPNIADRSRSTPLHGAIANQHYETTGCLLALFPTIDPSIKNAKGETALEGTH